MLISLPEVLVHPLPEDRVARSAPGCRHSPVWCGKMGMRRESGITRFKALLSVTMGQ